MKAFLILIVIAEIGLGGYAYYKNPKACAKLGADVVEIFKAPAGPDSPATGSDASAVAAVSPDAPSPAPDASMPAAATQPAAAPVAAAAPTGLSSAVNPESDQQAEQDISNQFDMKSVTYADALVQAKAQKKLVLLDFTGSDWCPYCQDLDREVLSSRSFENYSVAKFVFVVVDFPHETQLMDDIKSQNDMLQKKYGVNGYPTLIVTDADGKELGRTSGYNPGSGAASVIESLNSFSRN